MLVIPGSLHCHYYYPDYTIVPSSFLFVTDDSNWHHYSLSFSTSNEQIRIALGDYSHSNYPQAGVAGDSFFANILVTDSYGPSPFISTSLPENFRTILVDTLSMVADTVSYKNSDAAININLASGYASGGFSEGDTLNDIPNIIGSDYNDSISGNNDDNTLSGGDGHDSITAGVGNDTLIGGNGNDKFIITTDITAATIQDFEIGNDVIDLRFFSNLNSFSAIIESASYSNGNTIIDLGSSKTLTLSNINYNNLQENNFLVTTIAPTAVPTTIPSQQPTAPTLPPTHAPTFIPTNLPTHVPSSFPTFAPTEVPTVEPSSIPSVSPTYVPTLKPTSRPTFEPTKFPTLIPTPVPSSLPSKTPTYSPTISPTNTPTTNPTISLNPTMIPSKVPSSYPTNENGFHEISVDTPGSYSGTSGSDQFNIISSGETIINGGDGIDSYLVFKNEDTTLIINDFDYENEKIDLSDFTDKHNINDLSPSSSGGYVILKLQDSQELKLKGVTLGSITKDNFVFVPGNDDNSGGKQIDTDNLILGLSVGLGATFLGLCYITYAAIYHRCPFSNSYNSASQCEPKQKASAPPLTPVIEATLVSPSSQELVGKLSADNIGHYGNVLGEDNII